MVSHCSYLKDFPESFDIGNQILSFLLLYRRLRLIISKECDTVSEQHHFKVHLLLLCLKEVIEQICTRFSLLGSCADLLVQSDRLDLLLYNCGVFREK